MNFYFVLVSPSVPENVGAAARAVKTMGISGLRLVSPCDYLSLGARKLAYASNDVLENARVFDTLSDALIDTEFSVATTAGKRVVKKDYCLATDLADVLQKKEKSINSAAVVFGSEENGLSNADVLLCDMVTSIPIRNRYPSINLAQAVMVYAYALSPLAGVKRSILKTMPAPPAKQAVLTSKTSEVFQLLGMAHNIKNHRRILERLSYLNDEDPNLMIYALNKISEKISGRH